MRLRKVIVILITAVSVIGCGASNSGSAARIAGTSVTESELASALSDLTQQVTATQLEISEAELTIEVLNRLVVRELVRKLGAEAGITVTESEIAAERSRVIAEFGSEQALVEAALQQAIAPSLLDSVFEISLYVSRIGQKLEPNGDQSAQQSAFESFLFAYVDGAIIEVSPKYGQWNPASASVVAASNPLVLTPQE